MRVVVIGAILAFAGSTKADCMEHVEKVMAKGFMPAVAPPQRVGHMSVHPGTPVVSVEPAPVTNSRMSSPDKFNSHLQGEIFKLQEANLRMKVELETFRSRAALLSEPSTRATPSDVQKWAAQFFGMACAIGASFLLFFIYRFFVRRNGCDGAIDETRATASKLDSLLCPMDRKVHQSVPPFSLCALQPCLASACHASGWIQSHGRPSPCLLRRSPSPLCAMQQDEFQATMERLDERMLSIDSIVKSDWAESPTLQSFARRLSGTRAISTIPGAGNGLMASTDLEAGTIISFYPVHATGLQLGAEAFGAFATEEDEQYFQRTQGGYRQERVTAEAASASRDTKRGTYIDVNPRRPPARGFLGYLINDGALCADGSEEEVRRYYEESAAVRNCFNVPFGDTSCEPLMVFVTTRPVRTGEELMTTYGHRYWLTSKGEVFRKQPPDTMAMIDASQADFLRACESVATDYRDEIQAFTQFFRDKAGSFW